MNKIWISVVAAIVLVGVAIVLVQYERPQFKHPETGVQLAHAAPGDPGQGCAKCHNTPLVGTCATCHPAPRTQIGNIAFPHHNPAPGRVPNDCAFPLCHGSEGGDARYVKVVKGTHAYCVQCHKLTHTY